MTNSRAKGQRFEREVAAIFADLLGEDVHRRIENKKHDFDLIGLEKFGAAVECKFYAQVTEALKREWWSQACAQARKHGLVPVLVYRQNRTKPRALVPSSVFHGLEWDSWGEEITWTHEMSMESLCAALRDGIVLGAMEAQSQTGKGSSSVPTRAGLSSAACGTDLDGVAA